MTETTWTAAMSDEVARRIAQTMGAPAELAEDFLLDGADVMGIGRDEYAQWFHEQMTTPGGEEAWESHLRSVIDYRTHVEATI
jgi:hypothetical protein